MFIADNPRARATDSSKNITIGRVTRHTGTDVIRPYKYEQGNISFEFSVASTYEDRIFTDNAGNPHLRPVAMAIYIIERNLRTTVDQAFHKAGLPGLTDDQYADVKRDLCHALSTLWSPEVGVSFINSPLDKGLTDRPRHLPPISNI